METRLKFECRSRVYDRETLELCNEPYAPVVNKLRLQVLCNTHADTDMVQRIVRQLPQANQNLTGMFLKQF